ncbi:adenylate/guanylate cyclase domain-containing protein [Verrucomicrobium spinosum]|uniref:adenylate/guanylate cyclase domain-containing protein n=1 Tax=Verrucomicrobium spinosum TaxID=2736 RepID=UPI0001746BFE|nr:adenylate/guanylate cyclase domain-containing protein [Verrucomicrobium spinosum]
MAEQASTTQAAESSNIAIDTGVGPIEGGAYLRVLRQEQLKNARSFHWYRLVAVTGFLVLELWLHGMQWLVEGRASTFSILLAYWAIVLALLVGTFFSPRIGRLGSLAVPFLDMPMVFFCQWNLIATMPADPRIAGNFTIGIFVSLIMLAASSLERWQIYLSGILAASLQFILHRAAGEGPFGTLGGMVVILVAAAMCDFARRNRLAAIEALYQEQVRRERLGRYFSPQVAIEIEKGSSGLSDGQWSEVTVLFSDLRDFTTLSERLDTHEIVKLLNQYFEHMVHLVFEHGGTLDKYIGDGMMAYFGAPLATPNHAERAVRCALAMKAALVEINHRRTSRGEPELRMGVGLHTGMAVIGSIGAPHRREYTAIGDTVNLAARIEQLTKKHDEDILLSSDTRDRAGSELKFKEITETTVKGRHASVRVFAPV